MPELGDIPNDVYHLFDPNVHHEVDEGNLEVFANNIKELVREKLRVKDDEVRDPLRFSNLGKPDRQIWYSANEPEKAEPLTPKTYLKFLYGHVIEELLLLLVKESGHSVTDEQKEIEVDGVLGHIDAIIDGVVVDVKSASPFSYQKFKNGKLFEDDPFGYIGQISGYANVLTPDKGGAFLAFDKVHGDICILSVGKQVTDTYTPKERIEHLKAVITSEKKPPRCYKDVDDGKSGNKKLATNCSYCAFKGPCWDDVNGGKGLRGFIYASGPRWLTETIRTPDVPEIGVTASLEDTEIAPF